MGDGWLILRVFAGSPVKVAQAINGVGLSQAYCPVETERRPHPFDRSNQITVTKPMLQGYAFTDRPLDPEQINFALMAVSRARAEAKDRPNKPVTNRCKFRFLTHDNRFLMINETEMDKIRKAEQDATHSPFVTSHSVQAVIRAFEDAVTAPLRSGYLQLGDFQAVAHRQNGRAA